MTHKTAKKKWSPDVIHWAKAEARKLLRSPRFFNEFLAGVKKVGLAGEESNALVIFIVAISALLRRPINLLLKAASSAGKNWVVRMVLSFLPRSAVREISSMSSKALNYMKDDLRHTVLFLQERNADAGPIHPIRLLISENKVIREVTMWEHGQLVTKRIETRGPVASISTTTKSRLEIDDESRHVSAFLDTTEEQTLRIMRAYNKSESLTSRERLVWRMVHRLLKKRSKTEIRIPRWFDEMAGYVYRQDLRVRRYYPAFVEACKTICLIRSFQDAPEDDGLETLTVSFADFSIAALIFDELFVESLHHENGSAVDTRKAVSKIYVNKGSPVRAADLAQELGISYDHASEMLRTAAAAGAIRCVNKPEKTNRKWFIPAPRPRFVPDPEKLFEKLKNVGNTVRFVHPVTGEWVLYRKKSRHD
jgi:predicted DNA binding protein